VEEVLKESETKFKTAFYSISDGCQRTPIQGALWDDMFEIRQSEGHIIPLFYIGIAHRAKRREQMC
jgi:hypothetical protein